LLILADTQDSSSCTCGACSNVHALRLKVVVHSGEALFYQIYHFNELSGTDVILVHRLLKNSEAADEYLMLTEQAYADIVFPCKLPVMEGCESHEHLGQIKTFLISTNVQPTEAKPQFAGQLLRWHAPGVAGWPSNRSAG
jgi:hypothetical protein